MDDEKYSAMRGTVRDFKQRNKMGRFNPEFAAAKAKMAEEQEKEGEEEAKAIKVGDRCQVLVGGTKRGEVGSPSPLHLPFESLSL